MIEIVLSLITLGCFIYAILWLFKKTAWFGFIFSLGFAQGTKTLYKRGKIYKVLVIATILVYILLAVMYLY